MQQMLKRVSAVNRIRLLLELGKQQLRPAGTQQSDLDSALVFFQQAQKLSESIGNGQWQAESQAQIGETYFLKKDMPQGKAYFSKVIEARRRARDRAGEINAWLRVAICMRGNDGREPLSALTQALALARQVGDKALEVIILLEMGYVDAFQGNDKKAERLARQALAIQKEIGYPATNRAYHALAAENAYHPESYYTNLSNAYFLLADVSLVRKNFNQALFYYFEMVKDAEHNGLSDELAYLYFWLGNVYFDLGQTDRCRQYYQLSLAASHRKGEAVIELMMIRRMVELMVKAGKARQALQMLEAIKRQNLPLVNENQITLALSFGNCYSALKQYQRAEKYYLEAMARSKRSTIYFVQIVVMYHAGQFYVNAGHYTKAAPLLKQVLAYYAGKELDYEVWQAPLLQFKVDSALANYPSAIKHYQLYSALKDSIFNATKSRQIEELNVQYEIGKKQQDLKLQEKNIALLREQNKSQQAAMGQQRTQRNALVGGTALLLLLLGVIYNRYRLKRRSNQQLEAQQGQLRAQQKVIREKNEHLSELLGEKDSLLLQKDSLIGEKEGLLQEKDTLLTQQERLLAVKERLLKEIHHRVKNNLQLVMSLLNSQAAFLADKAALSAIRESQHRVQAMALIHQKLYQSEGLARIPMQAYIKELVSYLSDSYRLSQPVRFRLEVENIEIDVTQAVPIGLILNEAVTNACKYAFPGGRAGTVNINLCQLPGVEPATYQLRIGDDGVGLPEGFNPARSRSLGMTLMHGFSRQLKGKLALGGPPGLSISLAFAEERLTAGEPAHATPAGLSSPSLGRVVAASAGG